MAIKRRSKNEDEDDEEEEERPRRKAKRDDDDDAPPKRRKARAQDEDEDDDDDDDDDGPPRKRRKSRDEDDAPPPKKSPARVPEQRPAKRAAPPVDDLDELDELDDLDEEKELTYEEQLAEFNRKKAARIKQLDSLSEGVMLFHKHVQMFMYGWGMAIAASAGFFVLAKMVFPEDFLMQAMALPGLFVVAVIIGIPIFAIQAVGKCKAGPPKHDSSGILNIIMVMSFFTMPLFLLCFLIQTIYFRNVARYLKDKTQPKEAGSVIVQIITIGMCGPCACAAALYFLRLMGTLGYILSGAVVLLQLLMWVKIFSDILAILSGLRIAIARTKKAEETVEW